jgi:hypothetical protein
MNNTVDVTDSKKSTHTAPVVKIKKDIHPSADSLSVVKNVLGNYTVCVRSDNWNDGDLAIFCQPDSLVDTNLPEFDWLKDDAKYNKDGEPETNGSWARVKGKKLRGIMSYGLFVKPTFPVQEGEDCWEKLNMQRYEPVTKDVNTIKGVLNNGESTSGPNIVLSKYDIDSGMGYAKKIFNHGEPVTVSLKYHGCIHRDTLITMSNNSTKKISDLKINDKILSYNIKEQKIEEDTVEYVINSGESDYVSWMELNIDGNKIICTDNHLFYTKNRGYIEAKLLNEIDDIVLLTI